MVNSVRALKPSTKTLFFHRIKLPVKLQMRVASTFFYIFSNNCLWMYLCVSVCVWARKCVALYFLALGSIDEMFSYDRSYESFFVSVDIRTQTHHLHLHFNISAIFPADAALFCGISTHRDGMHSGRGLMTTITANKLINMQNCVYYRMNFEISFQLDISTRMWNVVFVLLS